MTRRTSPTPVEVTAATVMIAVAGLTVTAGVVAEPGPPGASPWVLVWALVTAVVLLLAHRGLDEVGGLAAGNARPGQRRARLPGRGHATLALAVASDSTDRFVDPASGTLATVGHVPVIAALSLLPLASPVRYIGNGLPPRLITVVLALATVDAVALRPVGPTHVAGRSHPRGVRRRSRWACVAIEPRLPCLHPRRSRDVRRGRPGCRGRSATAAGPRGARRPQRPGARARLRVLGALAAGPMGAEAPAVMVLCGMYAALATVCRQGRRGRCQGPLALRTRTISWTAVVLVALIAALVAVTAVVLVDADGTLGSVLAASPAVAVMVGTRLESRVARALVSPALDRSSLDRSSLDPPPWDPPALVPLALDGALDEPEPEPSDAISGRPPVPGPSESQPLPVLSPREGAQVLALLARDCPTRVSRPDLVLSERTVDAHLRPVFSKLAARVAA